MPKFVEKKDKPFEAMQWTHNNSVTLRKGDWIINKDGGPTSWAQDEWFQEHYEQVVED